MLSDLPGTTELSNLFGQKIVLKLKQDNFEIAIEKNSS